MQVEIVISGDTTDPDLLKLFAHLGGAVAPDTSGFVTVPVEITKTGEPVEVTNTPAEDPEPVAEDPVEAAPEPKAQLTYEDVRNRGKAFYKSKQAELGDKTAAMDAFVGILKQFVTDPKEKGRPQVTDLREDQLADVIAKLDEEML